MAYTVNEALCPRGIFQIPFDGRANVRSYRFIQASRVRDSSNVILASELWGTQSTETTDSLVSPGNPVSASRRPVSGITTVANSFTADQAYKLLYGYSFTWASSRDLLPDPQTQLSPNAPINNTTLDWIGRNHGTKKYGTVGGAPGSNWDMRNSNFLYLDGHVETKHVTQTVYPRNQWTEINQDFYTLDQY